MKTLVFGKSEAAANKSGAMEEQNNNFNYEYVVGLILSFIPVILLNRDNDSSVFGITAIILLINLFLFIKVRCRAIKFFKDLTFSSFAFAMSVWVFLHCMFIKYTASQEFIVWLTQYNKGMSVFNSNAFSFFTAASVLLVIAVIEVFQKKKQLIKTVNYIFIVASSMIIITYILIFPDILISEPNIKLSKAYSNMKITVTTLDGFCVSKDIKTEKDRRHLELCSTTDIDFNLGGVYKIQFERDSDNSLKAMSAIDERGADCTDMFYGQELIIDINNEMIAKRYSGELFFNGKIIEGYKDVRFKWYLDGHSIGRNGISYDKGMEEKLLLRNTKGTVQVFLTPPSKCENCEKVKSNIINLSEDEM
jgi:hypothetical protein